ncbi:dihydrofolate reductase family protein [Microbacterium sp. SS28]|uniref:dihydrofolate reductase family protein n=1 Tax=Microbacterium sp. SS28 TaxID=2919948 RepID=UPI001FA9C3B5|nr:dihydrofolate reductase family protein [Microbacterium sp. SS28]
MTAASAPSIVTEVVPRSLATATMGAGDTDEWMSQRYAAPDGRFVRLNLVTTITGATAGVDGTSNSITSRTDRYVLGAIRRAADVVVVGAETVRAEGYMLPKSVRLAIVTASGDLGEKGLRTDGDRRPAIILCPQARAARVREALRDAPVEIMPLPAHDDAVGPQAIVDALVAAHLPRIVCEGGPALATQFLEAGVVDEVCVTVSPAIEPPGHPFVQVSSAVATSVAGMLVDDAGFSYLRLHPQ